jgi:hypothetical protein
VDASEKLLATKGSPKELDPAVVELLSGPATVGVTTKVTVAMLKAGIPPRLQETSPLIALQLPWLGVTETKVTLAGKWSPISTGAGPLGPRLDMVIV